MFAEGLQQLSLESDRTQEPVQSRGCE